MKKEVRQLLSLMKAYICGSVPQNMMQGADLAAWEKLYDLSEKHKLTAVAFDRLSLMGDLSQLIPNPLYEIWKQRARALAVRQTRFDADLASLLARFHTENICYALVKGALCRSLYQNGTLRVSSDEDIIVRKEDFSRACLILANIGFATSDDLAKDSVLHYRKENGMYIELHRAPFPDDDALSAFFLKELDERLPYDLVFGKGYSFTETVNFLMLVLHAKKHFVASGFGLRTLADIAQYAMVNGSKIDWDQVEGVLEEHRAMRFLQAMFSLAKVHLGFSALAAGCPPRFVSSKDEEILLSDILDAGLYGQSSMSRVHSANMTFSADRKGREAGVFSALFPNAAIMRRRYRYAERFKVLLPFAYLQRIVSYFLQLCTNKHGDDKPDESIRIAKQRMRLMREYGMID